jgi:hypothetical protein
MVVEDEPRNEIVNRFENLIINNNLLGMRVFIYIVAIQCAMFIINSSGILANNIPEYQIFFPTLAVLALCVAGAMGKSVI